MKQKPIDILLERLDERTKSHMNNWNDRALFHLLKLHKDRLPKLDDYFHKAFRQVDVTDSGECDMAIWCLLQDAPIFWDCFESVQPEKKRKP